jgi:hypothetical protein
VFTIGESASAPLDDSDHKIPFTFDGTIDKITILLEPPQLAAADIEKLKQAETAKNANTEARTAGKNQFGSKSPSTLRRVGWLFLLVDTRSQFNA